jgi:hypothetical protein
MEGDQHQQTERFFENKHQAELEILQDKIRELKFDLMRYDSCNSAPRWLDMLLGLAVGIFLTILVHK